MTGRFNGASPTKRRGRPLDPAVAARREALADILAQIQPATVRQVFYQATVLAIVAKTENAYKAVSRDLVLLRKTGVIPFRWITDSTRFARKPRSYGNPGEALEEIAATYRKRLWDDAGTYAEIWIEKDALSGVVFPITSDYDVPLMVARGYSSHTFLRSVADDLSHEDRPCHIYHLGDFDPSGQDAARFIEKTLREYAPGAEIHFERLAVTPSQIADWDLPTRPTKESDSRAKTWKGESVELDAIHPDQLRALVRERLERHLPAHQLATLKIAEQSERAFLRQWAGEWQ